MLNVVALFLYILSVPDACSQPQLLTSQPYCPKNKDFSFMLILAFCSKNIVSSPIMKMMYDHCRIFKMYISNKKEYFVSLNIQSTDMLLLYCHGAYFRIEKCWHVELHINSYFTINKLYIFGGVT